MSFLHSSRLHAAFALWVALLTARGIALGADTRPSLAGRWAAGTLVERWNIGDWGKACGPSPRPSDQPGGDLTVREEAGELVMTGLGRTFRSNECWELMPGVARSSHTAADRAWRTRCTSAPNDPRQTTLVTTLTATDTTLTLDETGEYQLRVGGQSCTASARRNRTFSLVERAGEPARPRGPEAARFLGPDAGTIGTSSRPGLGPPSAVPGTEIDPCASPGPVARLEVQPARKWLSPGQTFTFRASTFDERGCPADGRIVWSLADPSARITVAPGGGVTVSGDAPDGPIELRASLAGRAVSVYVEVASPARYDTLLSAGSITDAGERGEVSASVTVAGSLSSRPAVAEDGARARKTTFIALVGALAIGLAGLGYLLLRSYPSRWKSAAGGAHGGAGPVPQGSGGAAMALGYASLPPPGRSLVCPSCRSEFPPPAADCPHDGNRLVPTASHPPEGGVAPPSGGICPTCGRGYDPGIKACPVHGEDLVPALVHRATHGAAAAGARGKICPSCGARYEGPALFCGKDGTALVLVN